MANEAKNRVMTGARALVYMGENLVGMFSSCNWSVMQEKVPIYILGRFNPAEITPTAQEPIRLSLTGFRQINKGPYAVAKATMLKDLIDEGDFTVKVFDRQTQQDIFTAFECRVVGWRSGVSARAVTDVQIDVIGIKGGDEAVAAADGFDDRADAANLTSGTGGN